MSIPPLVCSTPPPPEQCEDDKDHEDFDLPYNLSQDDDEDGTEFSYSNYTSYNTYHTTTEPVDELKWPHNLSEHVENIEKFSIENEINPSSNITPVTLNHDNTSKVEESTIEDLNLIVDKDNIDSTDLEQSLKLEGNKDDNSSESSDNDSRIKDQGGTSDAEQDLTATIDSNETASNSPYSNEEVCENMPNTEVSEEIDNTTLDIEIKDHEEIVEDRCDQFAFTDSLVSENILICENVDVNTTIDNEDDFGDFEDFQFTSTQSAKVLPVSSENPWEDRNSESPSFVEFKANFDNSETISKENDVSTKIEDDETDYGDDDFGDFDDFKSSDDKGTTEEVQDPIVTPNVSVFDVSSPDNEIQICESINNLLTPIFTEEIIEPENEIMGKLESLLSETWGHLVEIDVRQPYMVNWNNSLGQKTLLKALCIDSRNILFGPKWHYNMPKYAANLSAAPLQPQKQVQQNNTANTDTSEKTNKEANTWVDPFSQDGQESCNTENEISTVPAKRPTELDVIGETPKQINKIYSSTIKVQPVRHINLPDTHIFTPTDSETPRSKTIHYDIESNPVSIPVIENNRNEEKPPSESVDNEYWEFQDFKAPIAEVPSNNITQPTEIKADTQLQNVLPNPPGTHQTQILQPIKMVPIIPTLNWPDPGEVKETFDDFSDFISNSTWDSDKGNNAVVEEKKVDEVLKKDVNSVKPECINDDFETFQSAPAATVTSDILETFTTPHILPSKVIPKTIPESNNKSILSDSKDKKVENNVRVENSSPSLLKSSANDVMFKQIPHLNPIKHMTSDILQPTNASTSGFSRNQQSSGQILQPLSLEGYSQINWPNPGIDLQDLSRFNPVDSVHTIKNDGSVSGNSKGSSPAHNTSVAKEISDDDIWGDFVSSAPKAQQASPKKTPTFLDDDEWTDFVSSPSVKPVNGLSTISLNVHTNLNMHKTNKLARTNQMQIDIPQLNYITPKSNNRGIYTEKHFQNL